MLGCTLTIEPAAQMNWAVGDQKISMNKKTPFRDTRLQVSVLCRVCHVFPPLVSIFGLFPVLVSCHYELSMSSCVYVIMC